MSGRTFLKLFSSVALLLLAGYIVTKLLKLMNEPSSFLVGVGVLGIIVVLWLGFIILRRIWRGKRIATQVKELSMYIIISTFAFGGAGCSGCGCQVIEPGHVGITINKTGDDRGVDQLPTETGWVWFNPITQTVFDYPVFVQTAVWSQAKKENEKGNEEISFNTNDGSVVTCDVSLSYILDHKKVPAFYVKFRSDDLEAFTHGFLRNVARDAFNEVASHYRVEDIYGEKKEEFLVKVREKLNSFMDSYGVQIEQMGTVGPMRIPQVVADALNQKLAAMQTAMKMENEVKQREAEAKKVVVDAEANAKKIKIEAEANAEANRLLSNSLTPMLLSWETMRKWNGGMPQVVGGGSLMLQLPKF